MLVRRVRINNVKYKMLLNLLGISHFILYPQTEKMPVSVVDAQ